MKVIISSASIMEASTYPGLISNKQKNPITFLLVLNEWKQTNKRNGSLHSGWWPNNDLLHSCTSDLWAWFQCFPKLSVRFENIFSAILANWVYISRTSIIGFSDVHQLFTYYVLYNATFIICFSAWFQLRWTIFNK